jgi:hypothetical protein
MESNVLAQQIKTLDATWRTLENLPKHTWTDGCAAYGINYHSEQVQTYLLSYVDTALLLQGEKFKDVYKEVEGMEMSLNVGQTQMIDEE